jgi:ABC-type nickel/cobalt efflux system permease component RcnA
VEAVHSFLEDMTYQMSKLDDKTAMSLGGQIALLKYKQTRAAQLVMDNAVQIFGGRALTSSGMGVLVEKFQRSYKMQAHTHTHTHTRVYLHTHTHTHTYTCTHTRTHTHTHTHRPSWEAQKKSSPTSPFAKR